MDPRKTVERLVNTDIDAATKLARRVEDPWRQAQALAWVARFTSGNAQQIAREAGKAAAKCKDNYQQTAALAWIVAALAERGAKQDAQRILSNAIGQAASVTPAPSRAEALILLLQAAIPLGQRPAQLVVDKLVSSCGRDDHWRCKRAIKDAQQLLTGAIEPRTFFW